MTNSISLRILAIFALALLLAAPGSAQTAMTTTTLSVAMTTTQSTAVVASATGIVNASRPISSSEIGAPTGASFILLYVDKEAMAVNTISTVGSTNTAYVIRGWNGTMQTPHLSGAKVWVGPSYAFGNFDPAGACNLSLLPYTPRIVPTTGNIWQCTANTGQWTLLGASFLDRFVVGSQLTAAATLTITAPIQHVTSSAVTVTTILAPALPATGGCIYLVPDAAMTGFTTSTGGNIALASTLVANKTLQLCYDPGTAKWYPSY